MSDPWVHEPPDDYLTKITLMHVLDTRADGTPWWIFSEAERVKWSSFLQVDTASAGLSLDREVNHISTSLL